MAARQACSSGLALLAGSLPTASGPRCGVARRACEPDGFSADRNPSVVAAVRVELVPSEASLSLSSPPFFASALPAALLDCGEWLSAACGLLARGGGDPATGRLAISAARLGSHCCCALMTTSRGRPAVKSATRPALGFASPPRSKPAKTSGALAL